MAHGRLRRKSRRRHGAGSGIGQALASNWAAPAPNSPSATSTPKGWPKTEEQLKAIGVQVKADRLDVTEREAFLLYADEVKEHFGKVNQIYNNAGIAHTGDVEVSAFKDIERVMDVDFWGVVNGTKAFLPHLIASGDGHVVNVSSLFGIFSVPGQAAYNAAKFAVRGFTEALRQEMMVSKHPVAVTTVHPGGIKTAIARNATAAEGLDRQELAQLFDKRLANTSPERAAKIILEAVRKKNARVLVGPGRQGSRRRGAADRLGLPEPVLRRDGQVPAERALTATRLRSRQRPSGFSASQRLGDGPRIGTAGDLLAHLLERRGVEHTGNLVDGQHLLLAQLVAPVQRHHVLRLDQRRLAIGEHHHVDGHRRIGGRRPGRVDLTRPQRIEKRCVVGEFARRRQLAVAYRRRCARAAHRAELSPARSAAPMPSGRGHPRPPRSPR